ncbi:hypothetical protein BCU41_025965 [Vibrio lentus]|uniref:hypothetical protein n=1 Tax=Vibrio lentus TaxID=136468 RepID=UPI0039A62275
MQAAHIGSINQQIQTNVVPWFCPAGGSLKTVSHNAKNPTEFIENIIWYGLEKDLKFKPNRFDAYDGAASFSHRQASSCMGYKLNTRVTTKCRNRTVWWALTISLLNANHTLKKARHTACLFHG